MKIFNCKMNCWMLLILFFFTIGTNSYAIIELTQREKNINEFILDGFEPSLPISQKYTDILKYLTVRFGAPVSIETKIIDTRFSNEQAEIKTVKFKGITIRVSTSIYKGDKKSITDTWIIYIGLTSEKYRLKHGLRIGSSKQEFTKILGDNKNSGSDFSLSYGTWNAPTGGVTINFDKSLKAQEIIWEYWAD